MPEASEDKKPSAFEAFRLALTRFDPEKIQPEVAIRNTAGFAAAFALGALSSPTIGVVAGLGALNVSYSDGRDPYVRRGRRMLLCAALSGAAVTIGALSAWSNTAAVITATLGAFAAGMAVALGTTAADLGVIAMFTLIVFAAHPLPLVEALETGGIAFCGGLIQILLSLLVWPLNRFEPERRILANVYRGLASVAQTTPRDIQAPPMTSLISDARDALAPLAHGSLARDHSLETERYVFLLIQAERLRLSLLSLARLEHRIARGIARSLAQDDPTRATTRALGEIRAQASVVLEAISQRLSGGPLPQYDALERLSGLLTVFRHNSTPSHHTFHSALVQKAERQASALGSQISAAWRVVRNSGKGTQPPDLAGDDASGREPWRLRFEGVRARLAANLSLDSTVFRHAIRLAACVAVGDTIGRSISIERTYWIPMTIVIVLRPDFTGTFARGALRIGGTLFGLGLATVMFHFAPRGLATDAVLMTLFVLAMRWIGPAHYGIFVTILSGLIVLLSATTGAAPAQVIAARALNTTIGGALALGAYAIWPTWEKRQTRMALADMLDSYREYFHAVMLVAAGGSMAEIERVRVKGRCARSNAEGSVNRAAGEPNATSAQLSSFRAIMVQSHAFVHSVMAMESLLYREKRTDARIPSAAATQVEQTLTVAAGMLRNPEPAKAVTLRRTRIADAEMPPESDAAAIASSVQSLASEIAAGAWL